MPTNQPFTTYEEVQLINKFEKLNKKAISILTARCALRCLPLLAVKKDPNDYFPYWPDEYQARYLLSIWWVSLTTTNNYNKAVNKEDSASVSFDKESLYKAADAVNKFSSENFGNTNLSFSAYAAAETDAAAFAANTFLNITSSATFDYTFTNAANAADAALDANIPFPNIKVEFESDLILLEKSEIYPFRNTPLWHKPNIDYKNWMTKHLKEALYRLSIRQSHSKTQTLINDIWPIYKGIFDGKPDQKAIDNALDQLENFFSNKGIDETESNKLFDGKDDEPAYGKSDELFNKRKNEPNSETKLEETEYDIESIAGNRHNSHQYAVEDKLNRQHLVNTLAILLQDKNNHHHQTIGLLGHWGVGKTSVVELLKTALQKKEDKTSIAKRLKDILLHCQTIGLLKYCRAIKSSIAKRLKTTFQTKKHRDKPKFLFAEFNAWEYEHTDNLQAGIAQEMIKALSSPEPKPNRWEKSFWPFRKILLTLRFAWSLHSWKILAPLFPLVFALAPIWFLYFFKEQFDQINDAVIYIFSTTWFIGFLYPTWKEIKKVLAGPLAKEFLTYLKLPDYGEHLGMIPVMREHIKKLTKVRLGNEKRLLYVVDDLDRCGHKGIVKVLEAVRMVLDLDNVIVVIAVDQRIALAALALNYKELATQHHIEDPRLIARDYLAKIIHLPIVLTEPDEASVSSYLEHLWNETSSPESKALAEKTDTLPQQDENSIKDNTNNTDEANQTDTIEQRVKTEQEGNVIRRNTERTNTETSETDFPVEQETAETPKDVKQVEQLAEPQKLAFTYWLKHFELSNPRQIKRLNNSFNLLRNFYPGEDKEPVEVTSEEAGSEHAFPMMVTLFAFEYLNNLDDMQKRQKLKQLINKESDDLTEKEEAYLTDYKITPLVIELANLSLKNTTMILGIEPFVLPGIDMIDKTAEKTESR
ncbi:KAP family P-loop NTPase fold protein [Marinomonas foliarum]|uniref:KAP-like P-loop domain-containing protein n=1 Tax=Marinomonas foliarum TaxID=491950 RepID=A0A369AC67_9GAMM|nr:P-loop NTPase fold protein [Marinomonas foliarum]RCX06952.1 KAP-like P-loop domain-containing protein [Marinomonas foliarum]